MHKPHSWWGHASVLLAYMPIAAGGWVFALTLGTDGSALANLGIGASYLLSATTARPRRGWETNAALLILAVGLMVAARNIAAGYVLYAVGLGVLRPRLVASVRPKGDSTVESNRAFALFGTTINAAFVLGPLLADVARQSYGWPVAFLVLSIAVLLPGIFSVFSLTGEKPTSPQKITRTAALLVVLLYAVQGQITSLLPVVAEKAGVLTAGQTTAWHGCTAIVAGWVYRRWLAGSAYDSRRVALLLWSVSFALLAAPWGVGLLLVVFGLLSLGEVILSAHLLTVAGAHPAYWLCAAIGYGASSIFAHSFLALLWSAICVVALLVCRESH